METVWVGQITKLVHLRVVRNGRIPFINTLTKTRFTSPVFSHLRLVEVPSACGNFVARLSIVTPAFENYMRGVTRVLVEPPDWFIPKNQQEYYGALKRG